VGIYRVAYESGCKYGTIWSRIDVEAETPAGTALEVRLSIAERAEQLMGPQAITYGPWRQDPNQQEFPIEVGETEVHAHALLEVHFISEDRALTPRLLGLQMQHHCQE
jgi:hypothetical protein